MKESIIKHSSVKFPSRVFKHSSIHFHHPFKAFPSIYIASFPTGSKEKDFDIKEGDLQSSIKSSSYFSSSIQHCGKLQYPSFKAFLLWFTIGFLWSPSYYITTFDHFQRGIASLRHKVIYILDLDFISSFFIKL